MSKDVRTSVIVPCRNEAREIAACLATILGQEPPAGGVEVLVADGMSDDGTREILDRIAAKHSHMRVIDNPGRIVPTGLNAAISAARGEIIVRMDAHTEYAPDYLCQCVAVLEETGADNVGGPWVARGRGCMGRAIAAAFQSPFAVGGARGHDAGYEGVVDTVYLGCWRRELLQRLGGFDEELVRNQDDELNLRLSRAGGRIWQSPRIRSWYTPRASLAGLFRQYKQYGYWKVRVIQKHRMPASVRHLVPGGFVCALLLLPVLGVMWPGILRVWLGMIALYAVCVGGASVVTAKASNWGLLPVLPAVFGAFHLGYGYGFVRGVVDFVLLRRAPGARFSVLTRPGGEVAQETAVGS